MRRFAHLIRIKSDVAIFDQSRQCASALLGKEQAQCAIDAKTFMLARNHDRMRGHRGSMQDDTTEPGKIAVASHT